MTMKIIKKIKQKLACSPKSGTSSRHYGSNNTTSSMAFHSVHGDNIRISPDGKSARRCESFCKGIAFSARPVRVGERVSIRFTELSCSWSGALRFGFTLHDPAMLGRNGLPKYACPDLTNKGGNWAKALNEKRAQLNTVLTYWVDESGDVRYAINGQDKGVFFSGVNTALGQLWALIDVYGNTTGVEFVEPRKPELSKHDKTAHPADCSKYVENCSYTTCKICFEKPINCILIPCGHMCACYDCVDRIFTGPAAGRKCPICRRQLTVIIHGILS